MLIRFALLVFLAYVSRGAANTHKKKGFFKRTSFVCFKKFPKPNGPPVVLKEPMVIDEPFDCHNKLYSRPGSHVFTLHKGASLSNCLFAQSGDDDTIHVEGKGDFNLTNVYMLNTGDDGVSVKDGANVIWNDGGFAQAHNKAFQLDGTGTVTINRGCYENVHILIKSCGNCKHNNEVKGRTMYVNNATIYNTKTVCGVNVNHSDRCVITGLQGKPLESLCTGYVGVTDPDELPEQVSKNERNENCLI